MQFIVQIKAQVFLKLYLLNIIKIIKELLLKLLLKFRGGCDVFLVLREKITSWACLLGSLLKVIFH